MGVLYSENSDLHRALNNLCYFAAVSQQTQHTLAGVLEQVRGVSVVACTTTTKDDDDNQKLTLRERKRERKRERERTKERERGA